MGEGFVERPEGCMFVQGFDFPPLTLEGLLAYPENVVSKEEADCVLREAGAENLCKELGLETARIWANILPREMQERIHLARVFLRRPQFVVLDEPLGALEVNEAQKILERLVSTFPAMGMLTFSRDKRLASTRTRIVGMSSAVTTDSSR